MTKQAVSPRPELRAADDAVIEDAIAHADPMVLRGLLYQLTGDPEVAATGVKTVLVPHVIDSAADFRIDGTATTESIRGRE
jgi:hypothetical protein